MFLMAIAIIVMASPLLISRHAGMKLLTAVADGRILVSGVLSQKKMTGETEPYIKDYPLND